MKGKLMLYMVLSKSIFSPLVLCVVLVIVITGYIILTRIAVKKYGYNRKREKELEEGTYLESNIKTKYKNKNIKERQE